MNDMFGFEPPNDNMPTNDTPDYDVFSFNQDNSYVPFGLQEMPNDNAPPLHPDSSHLSTTPLRGGFDNPPIATPFDDFDNPAQPISNTTQPIISDDTFATSHYEQFPMNTTPTPSDEMVHLSLYGEPLQTGELFQDVMTQSGGSNVFDAPIPKTKNKVKIKRVPKVKEQKFQKGHMGWFKRLCAKIISKVFSIFCVVGTIYLIFMGIYAFRQYQGDKEKVSLINKSLPKGTLYEQNLSHIEWSSDYDGDGLTNEREKELGTNMYLIDTDGDGITDYTEVEQYHSNPLKWSTADDNVSDSVKIILGLEPKQSISKFNQFLFQWTGHTFVTQEDETISILAKDYRTLTDYHIVPADMEDARSIKAPFYARFIKGKITFKMQTYKSYTAYLYNAEKESYTPIPTKTTPDSITLTLKEFTDLPIVIYESDYQIVYQKERTPLNIKDKLTNYTMFVVEPLGYPRYVAKYVFGITLKPKATLVILAKSYDSWYIKQPFTQEEMNTTYQVDNGYTIKYLEVPNYLMGVVNCGLSGIRQITQITQPHQDDERGVTKETIQKAIDKGKVTQKVAYRDQLGSYGFTETSGYTSLEQLLSPFSSVETDDTNFDQNRRVHILESDSLLGKVYHIDTNFKASQDGFYAPNYAIKGYTDTGTSAGFIYPTAIIYNQEAALPKSGVVSINGEKTEGSYYALPDSMAQYLQKGKVYGLKDLSYETLNGTPSFEQLYKQSPELYQVVKMQTTYHLNHVQGNTKVTGQMGKPITQLTLTENTPIRQFLDQLAEQLSKDKIVPLSIMGSSPNEKTIEPKELLVNAIGMHTSASNPNMVEIQLYDSQFPNNEIVSIKEGKTVRLDISDRLVLKVWVEETRINHKGTSQLQLTENYLYEYKEPYEENPYSYDLSKVTYTNLRKAGFVSTPFTIKSFSTQVHLAN